MVNNSSLLKKARVIQTPQPPSPKHLCIFFLFSCLTEGRMLSSHPPLSWHFQDPTNISYFLSLSHPSTSYINFRFFLVTLNHAITSPVFGRSSTLVACLISVPSCIPFTFIAKIITCLNTVPQLPLSSLPAKRWLDADVLKLLLVSSQITLKRLRPMSKCKVASHSAATPVTVTS